MGSERSIQGGRGRNVLSPHGMWVVAGCRGEHLPGSTRAARELSTAARDGRAQCRAVNVGVLCSFLEPSTSCSPQFSCWIGGK